MAVRTFNSVGGYSVGDTPKTVILGNGDVTTSNATFTGNVYSNIVLTDHILHSDGSPYNFVYAAGANKQLQFNVNNNLAGSSSLTFTDTAGAIPATLTLVGNLDVNTIKVQNNVSVTGNVTASTFIGNFSGSLVSPGSNTQLIFNDANLMNASGNLTFTKTSGNLNVTGNIIVSNTITTNTFVANANITSGNANLGNLVTSNYFSGILTTNAQPNITSVGTLANVTVSGNSDLQGEVKISGNLLVQGNTTFINTQNLTLLDPLIKIAGANTNADVSLSGYDGKDRGLLIHNYDPLNVKPINEFLGWKSSNNEFQAISDVLNYNNDIVTSNTIAVANGFANLRLQTVIGNVQGTVLTSDQPNITSIGSLSNLTVGAVTYPNIDGSNNQVLTTYGNGNLYWSTIQSASISNGSSNINIGTTNIIVTANGTNALSITDTEVNANVQFNALKGANLGQVGNLTILGGSNGYILTTDGSGNLSWTSEFSIAAGGSNTQIQFNDNNNFGGTSNFTFDKTSSNLIVTGNANLGNLVTANYFTGDGSLLTGVGNANIANTANFATTAGNANYANFSGTIINASQSNITSVGNLSNLTVAGDANINGNLTVTGTFTYVNTTTTSLTDPIIDLGGGANGTSLGGNDSMDRGTLLHYYTTQPVDAFMGWKNANSEFILGSNVSVSNNVVTINSLGNLRANVVIGDLVANIANANTINFVNNITGGNLVSANYIAGDGYKISNIAGANITGTVANANYATYSGTAYSVSAGNVSGTVANANYAIYASDVVNASQGNITSLGTLVNLTINGNLTSGNANLGNVATASYFVGDGSNLTNISATSGTAATVSTAAQPNITSVGTLTSLNVAGPANLGNVSNVHVFGGSNGYFLSTDGNGNLSWNTTNASVSSNITNVVAGSAIGVNMDYTDPNYPSGKFTIYQLGPVSMTATDTWTATSSSTKNAYANYLASSINTSNISITLSLANANFSVQSSDTITIGGNTITGANLVSLGIANTGGTYTIPNTKFSSTVQTQTTSAVSLSLTTTRGVQTTTGTTLTATQPVPFTLNSLTGSFSSSSVAYWNLNQSFNWSASVTGTATAGNITFSGGVISSTNLTAVGATSGTSTSVDSTSSYTLTSSDFYGSGLYGYGNRTIPTTVNGTVNAATKYYPIFWKITSNSTIPTFTTADSHNSNTYATGQGATTNTTTTDFLWIAIPNYPSNSSGLATHTFKHVFGGFDIVDDPTGHTATQSISANGQSYNYSIYGFTGFTTASFILTTS